MNHCKILTILMLTVAENDLLPPEGKGHYYPHISDYKVQAPQGLYNNPGSAHVTIVYTYCLNKK